MRDKRIWYPGATYHVMSRGIRRLTICKDETDYEIFCMVLKRTKEKLPFKLHSFCVMTNHLHRKIMKFRCLTPLKKNKITETG